MTALMVSWDSAFGVTIAMFVVDEAPSVVVEVVAIIAGLTALLLLILRVPIDVLISGCLVAVLPPRGGTVDDDEIKDDDSIVVGTVTNTSRSPTPLLSLLPPRKME
jgi:hypothetical protein